MTILSKLKARVVFMAAMLLLSVIYASSVLLERLELLDNEGDE